jgi:autotransporter-associated beta strand protein
MGREPVEKRRAAARLKQSAALLALSVALPQTALALGSIDTNGTYHSNTINSGDTPTFNGGTLVLDATPVTIANNFKVTSSSTVTSMVDAQGHSVVFSGVISDATTATTTPGALTFEDTVGGGTVTLTGVNTMIGAVTVNSGVTLALSGGGSIATASSITDNGTFDISQTTGGARIVSLSGAGNIVLGSQNLTLTAGLGTFSGVISGAGELVMAGGSEVLSGANTYTGGTVITGGTLYVGDGTTNGSILGNVSTAGTLGFNHSDAITFGGVVSGSGGLTQAGTGTLTLTAAETYSGATTITAGTLVLGAGASIANSSGVAIAGTLDISQTGGVSMRALSGAGDIELGGQTLTISGGSAVYSGTINGSGNLVVTGGNETLSGTLNYTGTTTVTAGTLRYGGTAVGNAITDNGTVAFANTGSLTMSGVVSGSGILAQSGTGITTITAAQLYTGETQVNNGTLILSGAGNFANTSDILVSGTLDISAAASAISVPSLAGSGTVQIGAQTLTLTNASGTFSGNIAGTGNLVLSGGNETLSGNNSLSGVVTISAGTLSLTGASALAAAARVTDDGTLDVSGASGAQSITTVSVKSLDGSGAVTLGDRILVLTGAADTFSGAISGSGGVTVSGGTEVLAGASSYSGGTVITAGTLALSGGGSLAATGGVTANGTFDISAAGGAVSIGSLAGSGIVTLGANGLTLTNASGSFSGVISGTGGLTLTGGTQILGGNNNYAGGTTIQGGTLQVGTTLSAGAITGNVLDNGTLAFGRSDSLVFAGTISGSGQLAQNGLGTTALTAANTFTGGTVITSGTLQIGNGGTSGGILGDVTDNGTLAFNRSDATSFAGAIAGTGGVNALGTGLLTLTAANSYTGVTTIASGSQITLAAGASIATSSDVTDNGVLDLSAVTAPSLASLGGNGSVLLGAQTLTLTAGADTFSGAIGGSGGVAVTGGKQILSGADSYTGATSVTGGTLTVNGSIAASSGVAVTGAGTLAGSGTISSVSVSSGGTLAPGSAGSGTLKVNGNIGIASDGKFVETESSASSASVSATGTAALGGTLSVVSTDGTYQLGQKVAVLTAAAGVSGTFSAAPITGTGAQFNSKVSYDANNVYLEVDLAKLSPLLPGTATANQKAPVAGIDRAIAAGDTVPVGLQNLGNLTSDALGAGASQLSGEIAADTARAARDLSQPFMDAMFAHLQDASARRGLWAYGFTGSNLVMGDATQGSHNFKSHTDGVAVGMDWRSPHLTLGVALSAANDGFHVADNPGTGRGDAYQAAVYGQMRFTPVLYASFAGALGFDDLTTNRALTVSGTDQLMGKVKPFTAALRYETGLTLGQVNPYAAIDDTLVSLPSYAESAVSGNSTFALDHGAQHANTAMAELGVRQNNQMPFDRSWTVTVSDRLAWSHLLSQPWNAPAEFTALPDSDFTVYGAKEGRDGALVSLGGDLRNRNGLLLHVGVEARASSTSQSYTGIAGLGYTW